MKCQRFYVIGILTAVTALLAVPEMAMARGGGGGGRGNGQNMLHSDTAYQHRYREQEHLQSSQQRRAMGSTVSQGSFMQGNQARDRERRQLRDPATHITQGTE